MTNSLNNEVTDVTDADIQALAAEATAAGNDNQVALCRGAGSDNHGATSKTLERLGYQRREHQLLGAGASRTGWWKIGAGGRVTHYMGRTAREAARKICVETILDARRNTEDS
jgi:hypothetical protein